MIKKSSTTRANKFAGTAIKNKSMTTQELPVELQKAVIRKFEKLKVYSRFIDNIWSADLADIQLLSKFDKGICFL